LTPKVRASLVDRHYQSIGLDQYPVPQEHTLEEKHRKGPQRYRVKNEEGKVGFYVHLKPSPNKKVQK